MSQGDEQEELTVRDIHTDEPPPGNPGEGWLTRVLRQDNPGEETSSAEE